MSQDTLLTGTVLLVEDSPTLAHIALRALESLDTTVLYAADGTTAFQHINDHHPAVVLLDIKLPDISGWDILDYLTETYGRRAVKVIVMTSHEDNPDILKQKIRLISRYLLKPVDPEMLADVTRDLLTTVTS